MPTAETLALALEIAERDLKDARAELAALRAQIEAARAKRRARDKRNRARAAGAAAQLRAAVPGVCRDCGTREGARIGPDPYNAEIHGDLTHVWLCDQCRINRAEEI